VTSSIRHFSVQRLACAAAVSTAALLASSGAMAGQTKAFVVSWFYPSVSAQGNEKDCPKGNNPDAATNVIRILQELGKSPQEVEKLMEDFPHSIYMPLATRGRIDGKPVSPYTNPTSVPDPNLLVVEGTQALGFNLDGNEKTGGFMDPNSGEKGVDNQLFRAYGCTGVMRAEPNARPTWTTIQWQTVQLQMPAWLIEVSGIDDMKNDPEVEIRVVQATRPVILDANSEPQADMTFIEDENPVTKSTVRGSIKDGVLNTEAFELALNGHRWAWSELRLNKARLRFSLEDNGTVKGIIGGYHKWMPLYLPQAEGGAGYEGMLSMDLPGMYYAFRKLADADPDPKTGLNTSISTAFSFEAVPAFIQRDAKTAAAK